MDVPQELGAPARSLLSGACLPGGTPRGGAQRPLPPAQPPVLEEDGRRGWSPVASPGSGDGPQVTFMGRVVICHHRERVTPSRQWASRDRESFIQGKFGYFLKQDSWTQREKGAHSRGESQGWGT